MANGTPERKSDPVYTRFERFWHWTQAALIIFLALTGFEVHGSISLFGYQKAVEYHRTAAWLLLGLIAFAIFWHLTTGEWKQYIPTTRMLRRQILFYLVGMFKGEKHPSEKTEIQKLNPLQRIVYLQFKLILIPVLVVSGLLYRFHKYIDHNDIVIVSKISLSTIALWHTLAAFLLVAFLIVHIYMATTGKTPVSNIRAMVTGREDDTHDASTIVVDQSISKDH